MTEVYQALLGLLAGGQQAADARSKLTEVLSADQRMDPAMRALLSQVITDEGKTQPDAPRDVGDRATESRRSRSLRHRMSAMRAELQELREHNDGLAAALGACYQCWGNDARCEVCRGTGRAGTFEPDRRLFKKFVSPAIRALQASQPPALARTTDPQSTGGTP
jgi:hypothetical protein